MEHNKEPHLSHRIRETKQDANAKILEAIRRKLYEDPFLNSEDIEIVVRARVVDLLGSVADEGDKELAEGLAESVEGVIRVVNKLKVSGSHLDTSFQNPVTLRERINKMRLY